MQGVGAGATSAWVSATNVLFIPSVALTVVLSNEWDTYEDLVNTRRTFVRVNDTPTAGFAFVYWRSATPGPDNVALTTPEEFLFVTDHYEATSSGVADVGTPANRTPQYVRIAERSVADPTNTSLWRWVSEAKSFLASSTPTAPSVSASQGTGAGEIILNLGIVADPAGRAITRYEYRVDGVGAWTDLGGGLGVGPRSILGFNPLQSYSFEVRAVNANGNGATATTGSVIAGNPPVLPPAVTNLVFNSQQITLDGAYTVVTHIDGTKCIVSSSPVNLLSKTPATIPTAGAVRHGAIKNPQRRVQAFDTRMGQFNTAALAAFPVSLSVGDILLSAVSMPEGSVAHPRSGMVDSYDMVYVASSAPNPLSLGPAAIGWPGRTTLTVPAPVDYLAKAALLPTTYSIAGQTYRTVAQVDRSLRFNPAHALTWAGSNGGGDPGYESAFPHNWASPLNDTVGTGSNYAVVVVEDINFLLWSLLAPVSDVPLATKAKIMMWFDSYAFQCEQTWAGNSTAPNTDGGHHQLHQGPLGLKYWLRGDDAGLDAMYSSFAGNWKQCIRYTEDRVPEWFQPWGDVNDFTSMYTLPYPSNMFRRKIIAVNSVAKTVTYRPLVAYGPGGARGATTKHRVEGLDLVLESNPTVVKARIADGGEPANIPKGILLPDGSPVYLTMTLDTWPTPGFQVDDVVTINSPATFVVGDVDWNANGWANAHNPSAFTSYRDLCRTLPAMAFLRVLGVHRTDWQTAWEYYVKTTDADYPISTNNWPPAIGGSSFFNAYWTAYRTTIEAVPQPNLP
jgi:hypothetical protein